MTRYNRDEVLTLRDVPDECLVNGFSTILELSGNNDEVWTKAAIDKKTGVLFRPGDRQKPLDRSWTVKGAVSEIET